MPRPDQKPMLARLVRELPEGDLLYEPKWDGFRCLAFRDGDEIDLRSRHGRPLARYFPELIAAMRTTAPGRWALDGEVLVLSEGRFDFPALLARLHPAASRAERLAAETPATFVAFDVLAAAGEDLRDLPLRDRRAELVRRFGDVRPPLFITPATKDAGVARRWLAEFCGGGLDGVIAKPLGGRYEGGARAVYKVKHERTADCVVAGIRGTPDPLEVSVLMLGLHDGDGRLEHVGVVSSLSRDARAGLARELGPLVVALEGHPWEHGYLLAGGAIGRLKGAVGRWRPGAPLDWMPLAPERVCEVAFTQVDARRMRHPARFLRWRPDRIAASCRIEQLDEPLAVPGRLLAS